MSQTFILAGSFAEADAHRRTGLNDPYARHISSPVQLKGARPTEVHILPGFEKRRDYHAYVSDLRISARRAPDAVVVWFNEDGTEHGRSGFFEAFPTRGVEPLRPRNRDVAVSALEDTSPNAVPGQMDLQEAVEAVEAAQATDDIDDEAMDALGERLGAPEGAQASSDDLDDFLASIDGDDS